MPVVYPLTLDEYVVFCAPTILQQRVYKTLLESQGLQSCLYQGDANAHLKAITLMRKICNAVSLVTAKAQQVTPHKNFSDVKESSDPLYASLKSVLPDKYASIPPIKDSGKLAILEALLRVIRTTYEKVVLVSNFTKTLDVLQSLLQSNGMTWCRLDGDTDPSKRQQIVDQFNRVDADTCCTWPTC